MTNRLAMYDGYAFSKSKNLKHGINSYRCSNCTGKSCKAYLNVDSGDFIVKAVGKHNHNPSKFVKIVSGHYIRL